MEQGSGSPRFSRRGAVAGAAGVAGALGLALAGCGPAGGAGGGAGAGKPAGGAVRGTVIYRDWRLRAGNPVDEAFYKAVKDGFQAKYPEVKFEQEQVPFGKEYLEKFVASMAADTPQDAVFSSIIWARDFWEQGLLEDLGPYVGRTPSVGAAQYVDPALYYNSWKGKTFGVPHVGPDFRVLYVNRKHLAEAGLDSRDEALAKWTWTDLADAQQKLVRRDGDRVNRAGIWFTGGTTLEDFTTFLYANGGEFYNKDRTAVAFNTTAGQQVLEAFVDFRSRLRLQDGPQGMNALQAFPQGAAAAVVQGSWNQRDILGVPEAKDLDYTMMNIPAGPSGKGQATTAWTNMTVMPKNSKNKDAAWAFVEYYSSLPVALQQFDIWKQASPRKDFLDSKEWKDAAARSPSYIPWRKIAETGGPYAYIKNAEIGDRVQPLLAEVLDSKRSVRDALAEGERQSNLILAQVK